MGEERVVTADEFLHMCVVPFGEVVTKMSVPKNVEAMQEYNRVVAFLCDNCREEHTDFWKKSNLCFDDSSAKDAASAGQIEVFVKLPNADKLEALKVESSLSYEDFQQVVSEQLGIPTSEFRIEYPGTDARG